MTESIKPSHDEELVETNFTIPDALADLIDELAETQNVDRSDIIREALTRYVDQHWSEYTPEKLNSL